VEGDPLRFKVVYEHMRDSEFNSKTVGTKMRREVTAFAWTVMVVGDPLVRGSYVPRAETIV